MDNTAYIGIGSNQGDKYKNCILAIEAISTCEKNHLLQQSSFYLTEPWGYRDQDDFINLAIELKTSFSPLKLLYFLQGIEKKLARDKKGTWGPRTIDLDILFYNDQKLESPQLTLPHPLLHKRGFVLFPLKEIAPYLIHPIFNKTISQFFDSMSDDKRVIKLDGEKLCYV